MEREVVSVLKFELIPDTLYFWFDLAVRLWDLFVEHDAADFTVSLFKPQELVKDFNEYKPLENTFQLKSPENNYRVGIQALDLMSLHFQMHLHSRPSLVLALLALLNLREQGVFIYRPYHDLFQLESLRAELGIWCRA